MVKEGGVPAASTPERPQRIRPFDSLSFPNFRLLYMGQPFSTIGMTMRSTANAFQVYQLTDSPALLGLTFLFQGIPNLFLGLFGGTMADIIDRRRLIQVSNAFQILIALSLGFLTATHVIQVWHIYAATFLSSAVGSLTGPANSALVPKLVPKTHLMSAMALQSTTGRAAMLLGPLLGGFFVDTMGAATAYFFNAVLVLPSLVIMSFLQVPDEGHRKVRFNLAALFGGIVFFFKNPVLLGFEALDIVTMGFGFYPALMPVIAKDYLGVEAAGLGALLAAPAFGAMLGFGAVLFLGNIKRKGAVIISVIILHSFVLLGFAFSPWFWLSLPLVALLGLLDSMSVSIRLTTFQILSPDDMRGRVMSVVVIVGLTGDSVGGAYQGFLAGAIGPQLSLAIGAMIAMLFATGVGLFWKKVRQYRE